MILQLIDAALGRGGRTLRKSVHLPESIKGFENPEVRDEPKMVNYPCDVCGRGRGVWFTFASLARARKPFEFVLAELEAHRAKCQQAVGK